MAVELKPEIPHWSKRSGYVGGCRLLEISIGKCTDRFGTGPYEVVVPPEEPIVEHVIRIVRKNLPGKDVVSFRARPAARDGSNYGCSLVWHVFIYLGKELSDGTIYYTKIAGFYPDVDRATAIPLISKLYGKGEATYKFNDLASSVAFTVYVSEQQARAVEQILNSWDVNDYNFLTLNCTNLVQDVASYLDLKSGSNGGYWGFNSPAMVIDRLI
ncbi:hypothetical protein [Pseudomonas sp. GM17]|uniref:hypothetical protein n=1 Tax=Pseudomonas sp. GM17 TaxID=1144323 RepID=UPI0012F66A86|nr:hypothetical protein [Pseudomonas sp. GM17]WIE50667.1 hypothetical protein PMI20_003345 [Pseudomonas sp. GM17]